MSGDELTWMILPGLATGIGGLFLLILAAPSERTLDGLSGFTAGVMLAATSFSLLVPALDVGSISEVVIGLALGGGALALLDDVLPHVHLRFAEKGHILGRTASEQTRASLLLSALTLHNIPEGMAVGVAFAAGGIELGLPIALAIGIQNIPEGFAAAAPLLKGSGGKRTAFRVAALTGMVEPPAALAAFAAFEFADAFLPLGLAFAGGAMLYVVVDELIPESQAHGFERTATLSLLVGFALMLALDNAFG